MGLTDADIEAISLGWRSNMDAVRTALLKNGAFAWDLFPNQHDAGCGVIRPDGVLLFPLLPWAPPSAHALRCTATPIYFRMAAACMFAAFC